MKNFIFISTIALTLNMSAQKEKLFPEILGISLTEKNMSLPEKNGKFTIVAVAFHKGAEDELKKWLNPLYDTFMNKAKGKNNMNMSESHDVNFFFLPVIGGLKIVARQFKESTDKAFWPYIMDTDKCDIKAQAKKLGVTDLKIPYIFVLDKDGKVIEFQNGNYKEDKIDALEEAID